MRIDAEGFRIDLPAPWEGAVRQSEIAESVRRRATFQGLAVQTPPVLHLSSTRLPSVRGDFGSGAVDLLGQTDAFVAVVEYGQDSVGTALFDNPGLPRTLDHRDFQPNGLQRAIAGQAGFQHFCTDNGRALCLYAVIGATHQARKLTGVINEILPLVEIDAR